MTTSALDVSGSGALSDFEIVTVSQANSGPFDASGNSFIYDLQPGNYTVRIENLADDIFVPFPNFSLSFPGEADQSDGVQPFAFTDTETGETVTLELGGLTAEEDAAVSDLESFESTFGSGAFGEDLIESGGTDSVTGNVLVDGEPADTIPESANTLTVASGGDGSVGLADGTTRTFTSDGGDNVNIATTADVTGDLFVSGEGTRLATDGANNTVHVGRAGTGTLELSNGADLDTQNLFIGEREGADGDVRVTGDGSRIDFGTGGLSQVSLGGAPSETTGGTGRLTVADGAAIDGPTLFNLGRNAGGFGEATLSGEGSSVAIVPDAESGEAGVVNVGRGGTGALTVATGADLTIAGGSAGSPSINVGRDEGASGKLKVSGDGARIALGGDNDAAGGGSGVIAVGRAGFGYANVANGGTIVNDPAGTTFVGREASATGIVNLREGGARLDAGEQLLIGADFDAETATVQPGSGGIGRVRVETGASLEAGTPNDGAADIVVGNGDTLSVDAGATLIGDVLNEGGTVDIASGATFDGTRIGIDDGEESGGDGRMDGGDESGGSGGMDEGDTTAPTVGDASFSIAETASGGAAVGSVQVGDDTGVTNVMIADGNADVDGDGTAAFAVADDGTLTVQDADDLDFETQSSFTLTLEASDAAGNTGTGSVTVEVTKVDTTAPTVTDASFDVAENVAGGTTVGTVEASDNVGVTKFAIVDGNTDVDDDGSGAFAVADNGTLTVNDADDLDAENQESFTLTLEAGDAAGNTGAGQISVAVVAGFADTAGADDLTGTDSADTLTLVADGADDVFDAKDDFARDTLDLGGLDATQFGETPPVVDLREGFVETPVSGRDTISNFDTVIGSAAGDRLLGRDTSAGVLTASGVPEPATLSEILDAEQFVDGPGGDTVRLRDGQGIVTLVPDETPEAGLTANTVRAVSANATGPFDAAGDDFVFGIESANYTASISGFSSGDVLRVFDGAATTVLPDDDQSDGEQVLTLDDNDAGTTATITLTGLTEQQDQNVFNIDSFTDVFGDGALVEASGGATGFGDLRENGLDLSRANSGVTADLEAQGSTAQVVAGGGFGAEPGTAVRGFDSVEGSDFDDVLSAPRIVVDGGGADDVTLTSGDGIVYPTADGESETAISGGGAAEINLLAATGGATVDLSAQGTEQTVLSGGGLGSQSGTTVTGLADVTGSSNADTLNGDSGANTLGGGRGDDEVNGGPGDDVLLASDGADVLTGGDGADQFDPTDFIDVAQGVNRIADFDTAAGDALSLGKFGEIATQQDITAVFQEGVTLQDPTVAVDGFFADAGGTDTTPNIVVQDDGSNLTRVFIDGNGDGNYRPDATNDEDSVIELTGTIESTGISADAILPL